MNNRSKRSLVLIEMSILLLFFVLSVAICANIFASAKNRSNSARDITQAVILCENAAESFKAAGGDAALTAEILKADKYSPEAINVFYDQNGSICGEQNAVYKLSITFETQTDAFKKAVVKVTRDSQSVYEITVGVAQ